jgi:hypothetical protein
MTHTTQEARAEIEDTIKICQQYLDDAAENARTGGHHNDLFNPTDLKFAKDQIAFEKQRLADLAG